MKTSNVLKTAIAAAIIASAFIELLVCLTSIVNAQGVGVNPSGTAADPSAGLDTRKTPEPRPVPDAVTKLQALFTNEPGVIDVKWKSTKNVKYYKVYISTDNIEWSLVTTSSKLKVTVSDLESSTRYYFRIVSVRTRGESEPSATASIIAA